LLISDVPNNNVADIGSGLLARDDDGDVCFPEAPSWLAEYLRVCAKPDTLEKHQLTKISIEIIASIDDACCAAVNYASQQGYVVKRHETLIYGDAERSG